MERIRVDGAVLADCLFLIGQAWLKRASGEDRGAQEDLTSAAVLVPEGSVGMILGMIEDGDLPEPDPDDMDAWLESCRRAGAGEFKLTFGRVTAAPEPPALPPRVVESDAEFLVRLHQIRLDAEDRTAARQAQTERAAGRLT